LALDFFTASRKLGLVASFYAGDYLAITRLSAAPICQPLRTRNDGVGAPDARPQRYHEVLKEFSARPKFSPSFAAVLARLFSQIP